MKKNKRILAILVTGIITGLSAHAQMQPSNDGSVVTIGTPATVTQGNTLEKEVTPLLRDISKKKSLLELRKLDRELEKLEEETLTAQVQRDKLLNPPPPVVAPVQISASMMPHEEDNIRVLMVYGFDSDLYAKVSSGEQGGYIVRKGDILPDGRLITNITPNFLEVKKATKSKNGSIQKLYVSGPSTGKSNTSGGGSGMYPSSVPMGAPGLIPPPTNMVAPSAIPPVVAPVNNTSSSEKITFPMTAKK